jgi:hypothetical protein
VSVWACDMYQRSLHQSVTKHTKRRCRVGGPPCFLFGRPRVQIWPRATFHDIGSSLFSSVYQGKLKIKLVKWGMESIFVHCCPLFRSAVWWGGSNIYLVFSAFTSRPTPFFFNLHSGGVESRSTRHCGYI